MKLILNIIIDGDEIAVAFLRDFLAETQSVHDAHDEIALLFFVKILENVGHFGCRVDD